MNFTVMTLFPEMIENYMNASITGRALKKGVISLNAVNIRDYTLNKNLEWMTIFMVEVQECLCRRNQLSML